MLGYNELLNEECIYQKYMGVNEYNEKSYSDEQKVKCFISYDFSNIVNYKIQEIKLNKIIFIDNEFTPNIYDKFDGLDIKEIVPMKGLLEPVFGWRILV